MPDVIIYSKIVGMTINGENIKRSGEHRTWSGAKLTGKFRVGVRGDKQVEVKENGMTKWVSLKTFTGTIGDIKLINGERGQQLDLF